ncbi:MAG: hypothetical protein K0U36_04885 [Alphaproteobacteria bacterium]|nr:hypothetical protein [Alphaproteobacteria bacterium]
MTAATKDRYFAYRAGETAGYAVAASTTIFAGVVVEVNASGYVTNATAGANKHYMGVTTETANNSGGANGDAEVIVRQRGTVGLQNNSTNAITASNIGGLAYLADNQTVDSLATGRTALGRIEAIDSEYVWVQLGVS